jgi:apolipoprotein N-acyltransferase
MSTDLMPETKPAKTKSEKTAVSSASKDLEPTVEEILSRAKTNRPSSKGAWLCGGTTMLLVWLSFTPLDWGWLGWICLVPLLMLVRIEQRTAGFYRAIGVTSFIGWIAMLQWMRLGDAAMYPAWCSLAFYCSLYVPFFVFCCRTAVHRWRLPLALAAPVVWAGLEYFRAHVFTGFSWYYLGHTQYRWLELIQISDLVGVYGISFLLVLSSSVIAMLVPVSVFDRFKLRLKTSLERGAVAEPRKPLVQVAVLIALLAAVVGYGYARRANVEFQPGPRVALIQGNFISSLKHDPNRYRDIFRTHDALTGMSVQYDPDLIVWPETMFRTPITLVEEGMTDEDLLSAAPPEARANPETWLGFWKNSNAEATLNDRSQAADAALLIGLEKYTIGFDDRQQFNSVAFVDPRFGVMGTYDKVHRVIFGEYIPLEESMPWLHVLTPFPDDFGIDAGEEFKAFTYRDPASDAEWTFSPVICFEDTVPRVVRAAATSGKDGKTVDCLVNLSNDGWFHGSSELDQHLICSVFRAVECRTPLVRSVNTGISAYIDGDGAILEPDVFVDGDGQGRDSFRDESGRIRKSLNALLVHEVPLDPRESFYLKHGDWFGQTCGFAAIFLFLTGVFLRKPAPNVTNEENPA